MGVWIIMKSYELKNERWKEFLIAGDEGVFNISSTNSGIDKNKLNNENGNIKYPLITCN